ncbi:MAG: hypothetical protein AAF591_19035 [Verrucomicrobiota bacterium]
MTFVSLSAARAADVTTTLHFNPSLSREANPLSSVLGFDALQLVVTNIVAVVVFLFVPLLVYIVYGPASMGEKACSFREYVSLQLFRSKLERARFLRGVFLGWPLPKNWLQAVRVLGFALSWAIVIASLQATFAWWATNQWGLDWYGRYRALFSFRGFPVVELIPIVIVFFLMGFVFFRMEYKAYGRPLPEGE